MNFENIGSQRSGRLPQNVAFRATRKGALWAHSRREACKAMGLSGGGSCLASALAIFWPWANAVKWL